MAGPAKKRRALGDPPPKWVHTLPPAVQPTRVPSTSFIVHGDPEDALRRSKKSPPHLHPDYSRVDTPLIRVEEIPRACLECARLDNKCDISSLPCIFCTENDRPCIDRLRTKERTEVGIRRQVKSVMEKTAAQKTKGYGILRYLAMGLEEDIEEKDGWEELRLFIDLGEEDKKEETKVLQAYVKEMSGMVGQCVQEWEDAGKPGMLDPALFDYVNADAQKAWIEEQNKWGGSFEQDAPQGYSGDDRV